METKRKLEKLEELKKKKKEKRDKGTKGSQDNSPCAAHTTDSASAQTHPTATAGHTHDQEETTTRPTEEQDSTDSPTTHSTHPACADEDIIELPAGVDIAVGLVAEKGTAAHGQWERAAGEGRRAVCSWGWLSMPSLFACCELPSYAH